MNEYIHEQLDQAQGDARFNDSLNLFIGSIRKIWQSPACIGQNLVIHNIQQLCQHGKRAWDLNQMSPIWEFQSHQLLKWRKKLRYRIPVWLWFFAATKIGHCPSSIAYHWNLLILNQKLDQRRQGTTLQNVIARSRTVTCNGWKVKFRTQ